MAGNSYENSYSDPRFGVVQMLPMSETGSLAGTVAATEVARYQFDTPIVLKNIRLRMKVGGTEAGIRKLIFSSQLAGTGALVAIGTQALGTMADNTFVNTGISGSGTTALAAGDAIVLQQLGTAAGVYNVQAEIFYVENFA